MCFEMTQIIYLITDNEGVTTISSFHGTALPKSQAEEEKSIKNIYDGTRARYGPHIIKVVSMITSPDDAKLCEILNDAIAAYFRKNWPNATRATELLNDTRYQRSGRFVQTELAKQILNQKGGYYDKLSDRG